MSHVPLGDQQAVKNITIQQGEFHCCRGMRVFSGTQLRLSLPMFACCGQVSQVVAEELLNF
jgi:hypothetical protein